MLSKQASEKALRRIFRKRPVADLEVLFKALDTRSRMSVFRRLREVGYLTSYTHTGRYYTLADIPVFDAHDLWRYESIGFSRFGTLKATLVHQVESAEAGCTHGELEALLGLRVYNTLLILARAGKVRRQVIGKTYVYVSIDERRGSQQLDARLRQEAQAAKPVRLPSEEIVQRVLVEALRASTGLPAPSVVAARLSARGEEVSGEQVRRVYEHFGLEPKKGAPH